METTLDRHAPAWGTLERPRLVPWLDAMLRAGADVSIGADSPLLFEDSERVVRRLLVQRNRPVAHAAAREVVIDVPAGTIRAAIIGAVATGPEHRGKGLGSRVMQALLSDLASRGVTLAILWADAPAFYERLGFVLAGRELVHVCPRGGWGGSRATRVRRAAPADFPAIRRLHERERCRVRRDDAAWSALAGIPGADFYVMTRNRRVVAYGVVGRGHDLRGCLHEWCGDEVALPTLVSGILAGRREPELYVMSPPWKNQSDRALAFHGVARNLGSLAMMRVLDRGALLDGLTLDGKAGLPDAPDAFVRTLFGSADLAASADALVPLYILGLDSM